MDKFIRKSLLVEKENEEDEIRRIEESQKTDDGTEEARSSNQEVDSAKLDIWCFFKKQKIKENEFVGVCNMCGQKLKLPTSTTSPLYNHLKKHPSENLRLQDAIDKKKKSRTQPTIPQIVEAKEKWSSSHSKSLEITDKICDFLVKGYHPTHLVMERGFIDLLQSVQPKYKTPHESTFSRTLIPNKYKKIKAEKQKEFLKDQDNLQSISLTTDGWTSSANDSYVSLTCHYLDSAGDFKSLCWGNRLIEGSHTGENIKNVLQTLATEWNLSKNIPVYVVSDNARNYQAALRAMDWEERSCAIHSLQLAIDDAKKETRPFEIMCAKARTIVTHFNKSSSAKGILQQKQDRLDEERLEVIQMVPTRWNSEYSMLERLFKINLSITAALQEMETNIESLTNEEWKVCESYLRVLGPLKEMTNELGSEKYPTSSLVYPFLFSYEKIMNQLITENVNPRGVTLAKNTLKSLKARFPLYQVDRVYVFAMILDPRFKCSLLTPTEKAKWERELLEELKANLKKSASSNLSLATVQETASSSTADPTSIWSVLIQTQQVASSSGSDSMESAALKEQLKSYLESPTKPRISNPYEYWASEDGKYFDKLLNTVKKYLPIPASQISSERQFSTASLIVTDRRHRLTPAHVEEFVYLCETLGPSY